MRWMRFTIRPLTAFGSQIRGDTLFGQLCWAARERFGPERLEAWLDGYTEGRPFLVVSDGFPAGHLPRPQVPLARIGIKVEPERRKAFKRRAFIPQAWVADAPDLAATFRRMAGDDGSAEKPWKEAVHLHNSISRITATTGGDFAPYGLKEWVAKTDRFDIHAVFDETRFGEDDLARLFEDVGRIGYGRDASTGLGKFQIIDQAGERPAGQAGGGSWLTLAPCAPQGGAWRVRDCFYQPFTRFGRHGSIAAVGPNPFKRPILLADTGAVLTPRDFDEAQLFAGRGLGGTASPISLDEAFAATVHQGYAPVVPVRLPRGSEEPLASRREETVS